MAKSNVYTRTGDKGQTSLVGGVRVSKCCARLESYGTVDELNSHLGLLVSLVSNQETKDYLQKIQNYLFVIGSNLATDQSQTKLKQHAAVSEEMIGEMEAHIDEIDSNLPPLRAFVLPGGSRSASQCHVCRTVCRRAERRIIALSEEAEVDEKVLRFVNRLSDYLFVLSRKLNIIEGKEEIFWK